MLATGKLGYRDLTIDSKKKFSIGVTNPKEKYCSH